MLTALLCLAVLPASAGAAVRSGVAEDPLDRIPDVNGPSKIPDIAQVRASYDDVAGTVSATVRFYEPVDRTDSGHHLEVGLGHPGTGGVCSPSEVSVGSDVSPTATKSAFFMAGFTGPGEGTVSVSPDKRELTLAFAHPLAARRDLRCFNAHTITFDPAGHCLDPDCNTVSHTFIQDQVATTYFDGYEPAPTTIAPFPACIDGEDNDGDGKIDFEDDPGCRGDANSASEVDPKAVASHVTLAAKRASRCGLSVNVGLARDLKPTDLFPLGRVSVAVRGQHGYARTRRLAAGTSKWGKLRPGRYRVSASYPGDRWRKASKAPARTVTIPSRGC